MTEQHPNETETLDIWGNPFYDDPSLAVTTGLDYADFLPPDEAEPKPEQQAETNTTSEPTASVEAFLAQREPCWEPVDYLGFEVHGGGADKLSASFIAPLVAAARGYSSYDEDRYDEAVELFRLDKRSKQARRMKDTLSDSDILAMPWMSLDAVVKDPATKATSMQMRPSSHRAYGDPGERQRKYEFLSGDSTPIALHPAIPADWATTAPTVLIAEGLLKGDAALTGYLLYHGVSREDLEWTGSDAREVLRGHLEEIDPEHCVVMLTIAGVWNYRNNPEWNSLSLRGRDVWLGIDGDVATKGPVWKATSGLWETIEKKKGIPHLLSPAIPTGSDGEVNEFDAKIGIDDYLAEYGTWADLLLMLSPKMPLRPDDAGAKSGDIRLAKDGCSFEQFKVTDFGDGGEIKAGVWNPLLNFGLTIDATLAIQDQINHQDPEIVHNLTLRDRNHLGKPETWTAKHVPDELLATRQMQGVFSKWFLHGLVDWNPDGGRDSSMLVPTIKRLAREGGVEQTDAFRHTGLIQDGVGAPARFAVNDAMVTSAHGYQSNGGAVLGRGSFENDTDFSIMETVTPEEISQAFRDYIEVMDLVDNSWMAGLTGLRGWCMLGLPPCGYVGCIAKPGSGKSAVTRFTTSSNGPGMSRFVINGASRANIGDFGQLMSGHVMDLDDYTPNKENIQADRDTVMGMEDIAARGYEQGAGRSVKVFNEKAKRWVVGKADQSTPGFTMVGEEMPPMRLSRRQRGLWFEHTYEDLGETGTRVPTILKATQRGVANICFGAHVMRTVRLVDDLGLGKTGWIDHKTNALADYAEELSREHGWNGRTSGIVAMLHQGLEAFYETAAEHTGDDYTERLERDKVGICKAMETYREKYLAGENVSPEQDLVRATQSAEFAGSIGIPGVTENELRTTLGHTKHRFYVGVRITRGGDEYVAIEAGSLAKALDRNADAVRQSLAVLAHKWPTLDANGVQKVDKKGRLMWSPQGRLTVQRPDGDGGSARAWLYWIPADVWDNGGEEPESDAEPVEE